MSLNFAVIFGGVSYEHEISIVSAITLKKLLPNLKEFIFIDAVRDLYLIPAQKMNVKHFSSGAYKSNPRVEIKKGGLYVKGFLGEKRLLADVYINLIHGGDGEDGKLAGIFEFFSIPVIGPRLEASVLSFNKHLTKLYAKERGIKTLPYLIASLKERRELGKEFPMIVKPLRLGSSIGVSVVKNQSELAYALDVAYEFDESALVEPFIAGVKEYNLAGCKIHDEYRFSIAEEPKKGDFLDFEKKYLDFSDTKEREKAPISSALLNHLKEAFRKLYEGTFEGSIIRCDFFVLEGEVFLNEINPIPGSLANYLFEDFPALLESLAHTLPNAREFPIDYHYIHQIQHAKGK